MKANSIVTRLSIWIAVSLVFTSVLIFVSARSFLSKQLQQRDRRYIWQEVVEYSTTYSEGGVPAIVRQYEEEARDSEDLALYLRVVAPNGDTLFEESHHSWSDYDLDNFKKLKGSLAEGWHTIVKKNGDDTQLDIAGKPLLNGEVVQVGMSSYFRDDLLDDFTSVFWKFAGFSLLISSIIGIVIARSSLQPLLQFRDAIRRISESVEINVYPNKNLSSNYKEISELSDAFNLLLQRISRLISSMRDGLDTIAHETKTPLTRLRMNAEKALLSGDEKEKEESLAEAIEETDRLTRVINVIMEVAAANGKFFKVSKSQFDLRDVLKKVFSLYEDTASDKQIALEVIDCNEVSALADFEQIVQAVSNLVDNAIKFTPNGGRISLSISEKDNSTLIIVEDNGIGIPHDEVPLIWQRLFRGNASEHQKGLGLGLALVHAIVTSHGGKVDVETALNSGSKFKIVLPKA